jgi:magnesium transporter
MTTEVFTARAENTVAEVRAALLRTIDAIPTVTYIYVTDTHNVLRGVLSLRLLAVAPDKQRLDEIMTTNLFTVGPDMGWKDVAAALTKYNLYSIAVVDEGGQLLGIVIIDDVMRQIFPEA